MSELITIKTTSTVIEMAVMQSYLEDNNIQCFLKDEYISQVYLNVLGVQLQVRNEDVDRAIQLLIKGGFAKAEDYK